MLTSFQSCLTGLSLFAFVERSDPSMLRKRSKAGLATSFLFMILGAFIFGVVFTQAMELNLAPDDGNVPKPSPICWR